MTDLNKGHINICGIELFIGEEYEKATSTLFNKIYAQNINDNGSGHIILKDVEFSGLLGSCTIYFNQNKINEFVFKPEWNKYDLQDSNGNRMFIYEAVQFIANICFETLKKNFGKPNIEEYNKKIQYVFAEKFELEATIDRYSENFYIVLRQYNG